MRVDRVRLFPALAMLRAGQKEPRRRMEFVGGESLRCWLCNTEVATDIGRRGEVCTSLTGKAESSKQMRLKSSTGIRCNHSCTITFEVEDSMCNLWGSTPLHNKRTAKDKTCYAMQTLLFQLKLHMYQ